MAKLTKVQLPLALANNSGIARDAFKGCTNEELKTIEFDLNNVTDLSNLAGSDSSSNVTALTNIYKMFAASDNSFGNTITLSLSSTKAWLPTTTDLNNTSNFNSANKAYHVDFNGITWSAKVAAPESSAFTNTVSDITTKLSGATKVEITGTVATTGQGFKYKYTNGENNAPNLDATNNNSQQLPSNITTIKIVLKKKVQQLARLVK